MSQHSIPRIGSIVSFVYSGGTHPGQQRLIRVKTADGHYIEGDDLSQSGNQFRRFSVGNIAGVIGLVANVDEEIIPVTSFLATGNRTEADAAKVTAVFNVLYPDRQGVRYIADHDIIVVKRVDVPRIDVELSKTSVTLGFVNAAGKSLGLTFNLDQSTDVSKPIKCIMAADTATEFAAGLVKHFNSTAADTEPTQGSQPGDWSSFHRQQVASGRGGIYASK